MIKYIEEACELKVSDNDYINNVLPLIFQNNNYLSKKKKHKLEEYLSKYKELSEDCIVKAILLCLYYDNENYIKIIRRKNIFRYSGYGFKQNYSLNILKRIRDSDLFSKLKLEDQEYINSKINVSWLYDIYKKTNNKINELLNKIYYKRVIYNKDEFEEGLHKNIICFADIYIKKQEKKMNILDININYLDININYLDMDIIENYSLEDICIAASNLIELLNKKNYIKKDISYFTNYSTVIGNEIKELFLLKCKYNKLIEFELLCDFFLYCFKSDGRIFTVCDEISNIEQSMSIGHNMDIIQETQDSIIFNKYITDNKFVSSSDMVKYLYSENYIEMEKVGNKYLKRIQTKISRKAYAFLTFPELFPDEVTGILILEKNTGYSYEELLEHKFYDEFTFKDIILMQRLFKSMDIVHSEKKDRISCLEYYQSRILHFDKKSLVKILSDLLEKNETKIENFIDFFTWDSSNRLDIQYTPFIKEKDGIMVSISIASISNLLRNSLAMGMEKNERKINQLKETLTKRCKNIFKPLFKTIDEYKFRYEKKDGEIDVIVISEEEILLIECKQPSRSASLYELRSSLELIEYASEEQLSFSKKAFEDEQWVNIFYKKNNIKPNNRKIYTLVVIGERVFNGLNRYKSPVRQIHQLENYVKNGDLILKNIYRPEIEIEKIKIWEKDEFSISDLKNFLNENNPYIKEQFNRTFPIKEKFHLYGKRFEKNSYTYILNTSDDIVN